ncbi:MAG: hypothetical protein VB086_04220 [Clostridiaceae bacterium]|nr:hypothetical protein [Clostridiaceae bacterium]
MIAQKTEEMDKMEIEAIAQINKRLWGNYSYAEVTPDEILRKCAITFDNKVRMNSNRENGLLIRALSRHDKIYCQFAAGKPKPIGQDRLVEALSEMDGVYLMVYQYKVPSKPKRLFVFSNYEWVEDYFINRKLALTVTYSIFDGKRDMIVKAEKPMIKANRQDQEKNKATLSNIFSGSAKKLLGIMHDLRLPHLPNTKDSAYILDTQQVEICKILPYLLTA